MNRRRRRTINESRVMAFARFFELKTMTANDIGKYCGCCGQSASRILNENGVFRVPMVGAVDKLISEGFSFDGALRIVGATVERYTHNLKMTQIRKRQR